MVLNKFIENLEDVSIVEKSPKLEGRNMFTILAKKNRKIKSVNIKANKKRKEFIIMPKLKTNKAAKKKIFFNSYRKK